MENSKFRKSAWGITLLGLVIVFVGSFMLRPTADDYWFGAYVAQYGVWGATVEFWNTWTSFLAGMFINSLLVGWPLANLPLGISSAIPFWCAVLAMGYLSYYCVLLVYDCAEKDKKMLFLLCVFFWLSSLFVDSLQFLMLTHHFKHRIVLGLVHWQNLNVGYIVYTSIITLLFIHFFQSNFRLGTSFLFACLLGVTLGLAGTAVMLSFVSVIFCILCWQWYFKELIKERLLFYITFIASCAISTVLSMKLSPGHTLRLAEIRPNIDFTLQRVIEIVQFTFLPTFHRLSELYLNLSTVLSLGIMVLFWLTLGKKMNLKPNMSAKNMALFLTFCCFVFAAVARFSQAFSYSKPWHFIPAFMFLYLSLFFWSHCIAKRIQKHVHGEKGKINVQRYFTLFLGVHVFFIAAGVSKIYEREKIWAVGPAPVRDGKDIEKKNWLKFWNDLNKYRNVPFEERKPK